jgi:predicted metal-dependent hydrolase
MSTTLHPKSTAATRTVTTRRVSFDHAQLGPDRHYLDDDVLTSHVLAVLSAVIPPGERFVADSVRHYRDRIDGPLRDQARSFIGQEHVHQREHDQFNEALARLGYPTAAIERASTVTFTVADRLPARLQVAMTAAIEHWTAVIAEHVLADDQLADWDVPEEVRTFLAWHLVEELEHRAVAFDTMQAIGTTEVERIVAMRVVVAMLLPAVVGGVVLSLATDRASWNPVRLVRSLGHFRRSALVQWSFVRDLLSYSRPGFHPDQRNIDDLLARWEHDLFGPEGLVTARTARAAS